MQTNAHGGTRSRITRRGLAAGVLAAIAVCVQPFGDAHTSSRPLAQRAADAVPIVELKSPTILAEPIAPSGPRASACLALPASGRTRGRLVRAHSPCSPTVVTCLRPQLTGRLFTLLAGPAMFSRSVATRCASNSTPKRIVS